MPPVKSFCPLKKKNVLSAKFLYNYQLQKRRQAVAVLKYLKESKF